MLLTSPPGEDVDVSITSIDSELKDEAEIVTFAARITVVGSRVKDPVLDMTSSPFDHWALRAPASVMVS